MLKQLILSALLSASLLAAVAVLQATRLPPDAKLCGDHWVKVLPVNQGLYSCKIYSKDKRYIKTQAFMLPYKHWVRNQPELTDRVQKFDGETISLDKGVKLTACDVPYQAEMIRTVEGLVWVKYELVDPANNTYLCQIYSTKTGCQIASGVYAVKRYHWDSARNRTAFEDVKGYQPLFPLRYYGGVGITLDNKMALMPAGVIEYSEGRNSGLRVKYDNSGREIEKDEF